MEAPIYQVNNYTAVGDILTIVLCTVCLFLQASSYTIKERRLKMFRLTIVSVYITALVSILFYNNILKDPGRYGDITVYAFKDVLYALYALLANIMVSYIVDLVKVTLKHKKTVFALAHGMFVLFVAFEILTPITHYGMYIDELNHVHQYFFLEAFTVMYAFYAVLLLGLIAVNKMSLITRIRQSLVMIFLLMIAIQLLELIFRQTSFTSFTFAVPIMVALYLFHSNSYELETGTLDVKSFCGLIEDSGKKQPVIMYLELREYFPEIMNTLQEDIYHFGERFFVNSISFRVTDRKLMLVYLRKYNPDGDSKLEMVLNAFNEYYSRFHVEYKIVIVKEYPKEMTGTDILSTINMITGKLQWNTIKTCEEKDFQKYAEATAIENIIRDIHFKNDINDERIKVFCQPVYDVKTETYNTAEALMRIEDPEKGMLYPDKFIPIAERMDYLHSLTLIILHKTCLEVRKLLDKGYNIDRVSVNVSSSELRRQEFCDEITGVIKDAGVPLDKIALEITESKSEKDYTFAKDVMDKLSKAGIYFYLDDFGTGYSNMERLVTLPFNIIKFDRSMTILSGRDEESKYLVQNLADIFKNSGFTILFEGVEDSKDEDRCMDMHSTYLQGYKYSQPIPIEKLEEFLAK